MAVFIEEMLRARGLLLRTARARLRNPDWADDAVSETLLAALERPPDFDDTARMRAWLLGILRHKLADQVRRHLGDGTVTAVGGWSDLELIQPADSNPRSDPVHQVGCRQLMTLLNHALEQLPDPQARAFVMREVDGSGTAAICGALGVSAGSAWQLVHRARLRLRTVLQSHSAANRSQHATTVPPA